MIFEKNFPKRNILNTLVGLSGFTFAAGSYAITYGPWPQSLIPMSIGILCVFVTLWYYRHWSNRDPDRLQTEDFRLQDNILKRLPPDFQFTERQIPSKNAKLTTLHQKEKGDA